MRGQCHQSELFNFRRHRLIRHQCLNIFIENFLLLVGEFFEFLECGVQCRFRFKFYTQRFQAVPKRRAARQLAERQPIVMPAYILGTHDFIGLAMLQHAILMYTRFVRERIGTDHRLVRLHRIAGDGGDEF